MDWKAQKSQRCSDCHYLCLLANCKEYLTAGVGQLEEHNEKYWDCWMKMSRRASVIAREYCLPRGFHSFQPFCSTGCPQILLTLLPKCSIIFPAAGLYEGWPLTTVVILLPGEVTEQFAAYQDLLNLMMTCEYKNYIYWWVLVIILINIFQCCFSHGIKAWEKTK